MAHKPNVIALAVQAAGGRDSLARELGLEQWRVSHWYRVKPHLPADYVLELCARGSNTITPVRIAQYVAERKPGKLELGQVWPLAQYLANRLGAEPVAITNAILAYAHDTRIGGK